MALGPEVVYLVGLYGLDDADQVGGIGQVTVVKREGLLRIVGILVEVVDAFGVQ